MTMTGEAWDDAYQKGYDIGYQKGWERGLEHIHDRLAGLEAEVKKAGDLAALVREQGCALLAQEEVLRIVKDIRARMLTRDDFNAGMLRHEPGTFEEAERVMAGEDDCHLAKIKRGEAEAPIGGQHDE